mgnify:CR=1 FL=1
MQELIKIEYTNDNPTVLGRDLHEALEVKTEYKNWFPRMCEYGFFEGKDFRSFLTESTGGRPALNHQITLSMAKELCMLQRSEKGKEFRQYFIAVEEAWNKPDAVMARALQMANRTVEQLKKGVAELTEQNAALLPKAEYYDAVKDTSTVIQVKELSAYLCSNGVKIGRNKLFEKLRNDGFLCKSGETRNLPTQEALDAQLMEVKQSVFMRSGEVATGSTTYITQKGLEYFLRRYGGVRQHKLTEVSAV